LFNNVHVENSAGAIFSNKTTGQAFFFLSSFFGDYLEKYSAEINITAPSHAID
jgi:hypothetical protein